jgi:hypothetical protein
MSLSALGSDLSSLTKLSIVVLQNGRCTIATRPIKSARFPTGTMSISLMVSALRLFLIASAIIVVSSRGKLSVAYVVIELDFLFLLRIFTVL